MDLFGNREVTRRQMLRTAACGFGGLALHSMTADATAAVTSRGVAAGGLSARASHFAPRVKRVIFLYMSGGPSQGDLFTEKPWITKAHGNRVSPPISGNQVRFSTGFLAMKPVAPIRPRGESGMMVSDLMPHFATIVDDVCLFKAAQTDSKAHKASSLQLHTGMLSGVHPSVGSWISYGLGTENDNLPSFITITSSPLPPDPRFVDSGFLPAAHHGMTLRVPKSKKDMAIKHLRDAKASEDQQRRRLSFTQESNQELLGRYKADLQMEGMIESFELAFRMQAETPKLVDLSGETRETFDLYGIGNESTDKNGRALLLARRLSESGVRFVQVNIGGWDHHVNVAGALPKQCNGSDKPVAGLIKDLKRRGLLDETLVFWSGEFGRTYWSQDVTASQPFARHGREHQQESYACWMAGGGIKGGVSYGETDDFGLNPVKDAVHLHDQHATILNQLGLDHERLTYRFAGRDFRLTDVYGKVVHDVIV